MVVVEEKAVLRQENIDEEPFLVLENLTRAEVTLMEEKKKLETTKAKLRLEVKREIENKMSNIQNLRDEITDLKSSCDELSKSLQANKNRVNKIDTNL